MTEKFYICIKCGDLKTETEIQDECEHGGMGSCGCEYFYHSWNKDREEFDCDCDRIYNEWIEIPEKVYLGLKGETNTVIRLRMYGTV